MKKKGDVWISAVLYMALGVVLLSIIIAASSPVIKRMKDKNTAIQTKDVIFTLDQNIIQVYKEGPGSQRQVKVEVRRGDLTIDSSNDLIDWNFRTSVLLSEPNVPIPEGNLIIETKSFGVEGEYETSIKLDYAGTLDLTYDGLNPQISGVNTLLISNLGVNGSLPQIEISTL